MVLRRVGGEDVPRRYVVRPPRLDVEVGGRTLRGVSAFVQNGEAYTYFQSHPSRWPRAPRSTPATSRAPCSGAPARSTSRLSPSARSPSARRRAAPPGPALQRRAGGPRALGRRPAVVTWMTAARRPSARRPPGRREGLDPPVAAISARCENARKVTVGMSTGLARVSTAPASSPESSRRPRRPRSVVLGSMCRPRRSGRTALTPRTVRAADLDARAAAAGRRSGARNVRPPRRRSTRARSAPSGAGWRSTRSTTLASSPMPAAEREAAVVDPAEVDARAAAIVGQASRCSVASTTSLGIPSMRP